MSWLILRYLVRGLVVLALALWAGGPFLALLWLAVSFFALAIIYARGDATAFGKRPDGTLSWPRTLPLWPYLLLTWAYFHVKRLVLREAPWQRAAPGIWLGRRVLPGELPDGVDLVVDLTAELTEPRGVTRGKRYLCLPTLNRWVPAEADFRQLLGELASTRETLYVHCGAGLGRSASVVAALLIMRGAAADVDQAEEMLRRLRPRVRLHAEQREMVRRCCGAGPAAKERQSRPPSDAPS